MPRSCMKIEKFHLILVLSFLLTPFKTFKLIKNIVLHPKKCAYLKHHLEKTKCVTVVKCTYEISYRYCSQ